MDQLIYPEEAKWFPESPIVTVVVPVHNTRKFLPQALNSILYQSLRNIEVICVDDCSSDESWSYLQYRASLDKRVILLQQQSNSGGGAARNRALDIARGKYLCFVDSDDFIEHDILDAAVKLAEEEGSQIVPFKVHRFNNDTHEKTIAENAFRSKNFPNKKTFSASEIAPNVFTTFMTWPHNKLFDRQYTLDKKLRFQEIHRTNDLLFVHSAVALAERITPLDKVGINYRVGTTGNSQATNHLHPLDFCHAFRALKKRLEEEDLWEPYRSSFQDAFVGGAIYNLDSIKEPDAAIELYIYLQEQVLDEFGITNHSSGNVLFDQFYARCEEVRTIPVGQWASTRFSDDVLAQEKL